MNTKKQISARSLALDSLIKIEQSARYSNLEIDSTLKKHPLEAADRGLYTRLVYGVTEKRILLDSIISEYSRTSIEELDKDVLGALRLGVYQLLFMSRIPEHAAVGESAALVSRSRVGYVNAVLRAFQRAGKKYTLPDKSDTARYLSVKYSLGEGLVRLLLGSFAADELESLLASLDSEPKIGLRINTLKITADEAAERTGGEKLSDEMVTVGDLSSEIRDGIESGLWFVQDYSSLTVARALGAVAGETVVDTCACPGGKSFSIAIGMENNGKLYSFDLHENKLSLVEKGARKLGIEIIEVSVRDAKKPKEELVGKADRVLCDAPCSGLGIIAKKPDIRYKDVSDAVRLPEVQFDILSSAAAYVRHGGVLVYSTCTLNKAENEGVVERFLSSHPEFVPDESEILGGYMKTFLPHKDGCDGFFAARMKKL